MKPLEQLDPQGITTVLLDIDDTLTTQGRLEAVAFSALERLHRAGLTVIPVTGRPAGWCDHIARMWPVNAVVGENGAFFFYFADGRLHRRFAEDAPTRARHRARLEAIGQKILAAIPGCALSADQAYRESDLAIDFCEDVPPLPLETADRIATMMREEGLTAKISSIHVNGWFGSYDKLHMTHTLFEELFVPLTHLQHRHSVVFVGDSPNDSPMFSFFPNSVGVGNVRRFEGRLNPPPAFVTRASHGAGFAELVDHLLADTPHANAGW